MTTNNKFILKGVMGLPPIICPSNGSGAKIEITERELQNSNLKGFNNNVGSATNKATSIRNLMSSFDIDSEEYKVLFEREMSVQRIQQEIIDAVKNSEAPEQIPKEWYSRQHNMIDEKNDTQEDIDRKEFNLSILADKKPYFFSYIYPHLKAQIRKYENNFNTNCIRTNKTSIEDMKGSSIYETYLKNYPVDLSKSVVNQICWKFEHELDGYLSREEVKTEFDYSILKYDVEIEDEKEYKRMCNKVKNVCQVYQRISKRYFINNSMLKQDKLSKLNNKIKFKQDFKKAIRIACTDSKKLLNIMIDVTYGKNKNPQILWDICSDEIIECLLSKNNNKIKYYEKDDNGMVNFAGNTFSMKITDYKMEE